MSHAHLTTRGTGSSSVVFSSDSNVLVLGMALHPHMVVIQLSPLGGGKKSVVLEDSVSVIKWLALARSNSPPNERTVVKLPSGNKSSGHSVNGNGQVNGHESSDSGDSSGDVSDDDASTSSESSDDMVPDSRNAQHPHVQLLNISPDGQWLACQDTHGRIGIWSLDVLKVCNFSFSP